MSIENIMNGFYNNRARINGKSVNFYLKDNYSDKTIIHIHGSGCNAKIFARLTDRLDSYNHVMLDLPAHGESKKSEICEKLDESSSLVLEFAKMIKEDDPSCDIILLGHSLGGSTVLDATTKDKDSKIISKCISIAGTIEGSFITEQVLGAVASDEIFTQLLLNDTKNYAKKDVNFLMKKLPIMTESTDVRVADFKSALGQKTIDNIKDVETPMLIICGDTDTFVPVSQQFLIHNTVKNSQMLMIPNSGHFMLLEKTKLGYIKKAIENFIG